VYSKDVDEEFDDNVVVVVVSSTEVVDEDGTSVLICSTVSVWRIVKKKPHLLIPSFFSFLFR
jgi:hypothetical protein